MVQIDVFQVVKVPNLQDDPSEEQVIERLEMLKQLQKEIEQTTATMAINAERIMHEQREAMRTEIFKKILDHTCNKFNSIKPFLTLFVSVIFSILAISFYTMIPVHNVIKKSGKVV